MKPWRIAFAYLAFSVLALALFATPLWYGWRVNVGTLRVFVPEDMQALPDLFDREGADAVAAAVRSRSDATGREVLVFADPGKQVLAGTLRHWPPEIPDAPGTYGHVIDLGDGSSMRVVVSHVRLPDGYHLLVGRQSSGLMSLEGSFWFGMAAAMTIVLGFGAALAWLLARRAIAARHSEERYALAMDVAEEGHLDWNLQTDAFFASSQARRMLNVPQDAQYRTREDVMSRVPYHPDDGPRVAAAWRASLAGRDVEHEIEYRILRDEEPRWIHARWRIFRGTDGAGQRVIGVVSDITQSKQAEEALRKLERELRRAQRLEAMGTLAGGIAHDFNNILGAILGYGEMALRDAKSGTRLRRDLDSIMAAGERGRALVDRVLAFSRSGVGERVPVHVEAVVQEALDQVTASLPANVTIAPHLRAGRAAMLGDSTQVHQVVMNLASNAVQAMPQGGVLQVGVDVTRLEAARPATVGSLMPGDYLVLTVSDGGDGIAPDVFEHMFDPFFTTKEVGRGTGLGLSLVHGIVTSVDGAIDVDTAPGNGTTFTVYLRRSGDAPEKAADDDRPLPRGEGQRVLVVDDEEALVQLATETLGQLGYAPQGFTSSAAALAAFRADPSRFDALLTDERMPGLSGSALIREVRGIREAIPMVLMSGYLGMDGADADVVVRKPLSARDLAQGMARAFRR